MTRGISLEEVAFAVNNEITKNAEYLRIMKNK